MRLYAIAMFVHVLGVVALFGSFVLLNQVVPRLRRATRYEEARPWAELLFRMRAMMPAGVLMLLLSGGYLATRLGTGSPPWVNVAFLAVVLIGVVSLAVVLPYAGAAHRAVLDGSGALGAEPARLVGRSVVMPAVAAANGAALGTLWLMTARPGLTESVLVVSAAALVGAAAGRRAARVPEFASS